MLFYLRTGKRLAEGRRVITVAFEEPPLRTFDGDGRGPNQLVLELAGPGGLSVEFLAKAPGPTMVLEPADDLRLRGLVLRVKTSSRRVSD